MPQTIPLLRCAPWRRGSGNLQGPGRCFVRGRRRSGCHAATWKRFGGTLEGLGVRHLSARTANGPALDQGLEIGPGVAFVAVGARVGDHGRGLGGEQGHHLLVLIGERLPVHLVGEEEAADVGAAVAHRRALEIAGEGQGGIDAERADVAREVVDPQRPRQLVEVREQPRAFGPVVELALFLGRESRERAVKGRACLVDGRDDTPAGARERPGAFHDLFEHGVEVEARVYPEDGRVQRGDPPAQGVVLPLQVAGFRQSWTPLFGSRGTRTIVPPTRRGHDAHLMAASAVLRKRACGEGKLGRSGCGATRHAGFGGFLQAILTRPRHAGFLGGGRRQSVFVAVAADPIGARGRRSRSLSPAWRMAQPNERHLCCFHVGAFRSHVNVLPRGAWRISA